jgi:hypothetical protein
MKFTVRLDDEGGIQFWSEDRSRLVLVPSCVIAAIGLYDESRPGFDWELEAELAANICEVKINAEGLEVGWDNSHGEFVRAVAAVCEPGGIQPGYPTVDLHPLAA